MTNSMRAAGHHAQANAGDWKDTVGRVGLVGKGVLFTIVGILAIQIATGDSQEQASQGGAIQWLGSQPFGKFLLIALTVCLFALAAWRLLDAAVGDPVEGDEPKDRAKFAVQGVLYLALAVGSLSVTIANWNNETSGGGGTGSGQGQSTSEQATATVFDWPGGRWLVGVAGVVVIAFAVYLFKKHTLDEEFLERLRVTADSWVARLGQFGYAARAVVTALIGYFLIQAAISYDSSEAEGLSGALQELAGEGWGQALLWGVAIGLVAFGLFSLAEAKYRRAA